MKIRDTQTALELAAKSLRKIVLASKPGEMIGSEESLIVATGYSRGTVRQAARLLEREGLLKVRRGINGGYFGARPDADTIAETVSSYLEYLDVNVNDVTILASALWVEVMRKAAGADRAAACQVANELIAKVKAMKRDLSFAAIRDLELLIQQEIFTLARSEYVKLIFEVNTAFSLRRFEHPVLDDASEEHLQFVQAWRDAKLLELSAITQGDVELAGLAAVHARKIWHQRVRSRQGERQETGA